jgi:hypothetical protein
MKQDMDLQLAEKFSQLSESLSVSGLTRAVNAVETKVFGEFLWQRIVRPVAAWSYLSAMPRAMTPGLRSGDQSWQTPLSAR